MKARSLVEGAGIGILLMANHLWPMLSPYHLEIYHELPIASVLATGLALDLALISVIFAVLFAVLERWSSRRANILWAVVIAFAITTAIDVAIFLMKYYQANIPWTFALEVETFAVLLIVALLLVIFSPAGLRTSVRVVRMSLALFGCCIFWILPELVYTAVRNQHPDATAFTKPVKQPDAAQPRVVWVLMDELSYDQVFDHRQPDVPLPHFDELKNDSVMFSDVQPEGYFTERILPALMLGRNVDQIRSSLAGNIEVHDVDASRWVEFKGEQSIFGEAKQRGWTTGVAGWYNPYCHMLKNVLDSCYSVFLDPDVQGFSGGKPSLLEAMGLPFDLMLTHFGALSPQPQREAEIHAREFERLADAANVLVQDEAVRFAFVHLPVPHPPGIYDRKTQRVGATGTYLDNLALADATLGNLEHLIQGTAAAGRTTLIVSSDHSWRLPLWRNDPRWTPEEERATGGRFDRRPVLMIHFPGSDKGELRTETFPELETDGIVQAMLTGGIGSQGDLDRWLAEHHD